MKSSSMPYYTLMNELLRFWATPICGIYHYADSHIQFVHRLSFWCCWCSVMMHGYGLLAFYTKLPPVATQKLAIMNN